MKPKTKSGFQNAAADKIWNDHIGNNAYTRHRDQCAECLRGVAEYVVGSGVPAAHCADGDRILDETITAVYADIDEVLINQN